MARKLNNYLIDIDEPADEVFSCLANEITEREGVTKQIKMN